MPPGVYDDPFMSDFAYTPYTIDVIEFYKGDTGKNKYTWMWKGGETETDIYLGDDPEVEPGTEMIFFFSQKGLTSPYGIYEVVDGAVRVRTELFLILSRRKKAACSPKWNLPISGKQYWIRWLMNKRQTAHLTTASVCGY